MGLGACGLPHPQGSVVLQGAPRWGLSCLPSKYRVFPCHPKSWTRVWPGTPQFSVPRASHTPVCGCVTHTFTRLFTYVFTVPCTRVSTVAHGVTYRASLVPLPFTLPVLQWLLSLGWAGPEGCQASLVSQRLPAHATEPQFCSITRLMGPSTIRPPPPFWAVSVEWGLGIREPEQSWGASSMPPPRGNGDGAGQLQPPGRQGGTTGVPISQAAGEEAPGVSHFLLRAT